MITDEQIRKMLRKACKKSGSQRKWAEEHSFSPQYVGYVHNGKKAASKKMVKALTGQDMTRRDYWTLTKPE